MGRTKRNNRSRNGRVDRLSSLPDDILIVIISLLPLQLAIATGTLSSRWRSLWNNTTSIDISCHRGRDLLHFNTALKKTIMQIASPIIHNFSIDFDEIYSLDCWASRMDIVIRDICHRNVHQLVTWGKSGGWKTYTLSSVILQAQSLVSLELGSECCPDDWKPPDDCDTINLPNLKKLSIHFASQYQWIQKLIKACPSLEQLSLNYHIGNVYAFLRSCTIVIYAPNLVYLSIFASKSLTFSFEEEPIMLRETKIEFTDLYQAQSDEDKLTKFYEAISNNIRFLMLDISTVDDALSTTVFCNVTRLTFNMKMSLNLNTLLSVVEMCPVLDILDLKFCSVDNDKEQRLLYGKPGKRSTSRQALGKIKSINVEINNRRTYCKRAKSFSYLVMDLVRSSCDLEHFNFRVNYTSSIQQDVSAYLLLNQEREIEICKKLYWCSTISDCDVEFKGIFLKMSRKDGPIATTANGEVIYLA